MKKVLSILLAFICIAIWLYNIWYTDSRVSVYVFIAILSAIATICLAIKPAENNKRDKICSIVYAALIALAVALANYTLYFANATNYTEFFLNGLLVFATGFIHLFFFSRFAIDRLKDFTWKKHEYKLNPILIFVISAIAFCVIYLIVFYGKFYPGVLDADSINQVSQAIAGNYRNHHPVYHTFLIRAFLQCGISLGYDINSSIAMFVVFQIIVMSLTFGFVQITLSEIKVPVWVLFATGLCYALMPNHIGFASAVWKDVTFGISILAFIVSLYRIESKIGKCEWINYAILLISGLGFCIFRSNGLFAYIITITVFAILYKKEQIKNVLILVGILIIAIILKYSVLSGLNIPQHDTVEALSIPVQQVARVVAEGNELTEEEYELINHVADLNRIPNEYNYYLSDPMKDLIRESGNQGDIKKYAGNYIALYASLGMRYPISYINGWIDQTKGFWNGGYDYLACTEGICENSFGISSNPKSSMISTIWDNYLLSFYYNPVLQLLTSIGLFVWIALGLLILCIDRKSKKAIYIVPVLTILISIMISTPSYCSYRYIYSLFTALPFLIAITLA